MGMGDTRPILWTLVFIFKCPQMKLQSLYRYDSALYGLSNTFIPVGDDAFFINFQSVIANDHTIFTGHSYIAIKTNRENIIVHRVTLIDVYCDGIAINLLMEDIGTGLSFTIQQSLDYTHHQCPWVLIDLTYLNKMIEKQIVYAYCNSK
jgi:hypothetical protein